MANSYLDKVKFNMHSSFPFHLAFRALAIYTELESHYV